MSPLYSLTALALLSLGVSAQTLSVPQEALFILANYENMPKSVSIFQSKSRTFTGKIEIHSETPLTCTHTEKSSKDSLPVVNAVTRTGELIEFSPQRYVDHDIVCSLKNNTSITGFTEINVTYLPELLPDPSDEIRGKSSLREWLTKAKKSQELLKLDLPPTLCEENKKSSSVKIETGFVYRMSQGGETCSSPMAFSNGNIVNFCSKKNADGDYDLEARGFNSALQPIVKSLITEIETDTLRPRLLKTKLNKELIIVHGLSGKIAAIDNTGKKVFELQIPREWINLPTVFGENIYVASQEENGSDNSLYIINSQGKITSTFSIPGKTFSSALVNENQILIGNNLGSVLVLNHSGELLKNINLSSKLSHPGGEIKHLFLNKEGELLIATNKGEILKLNIESEESETLYLAPNDGKRLRMGKMDRSRDIQDAPLVTKNGTIIFITDTRIHFLKPDGSLDKIVESGNEFNLQSPLSLLTLKGEELIWIGGMGHLYLMGVNGIKKMEFSPYETNQSEAMAENYSTPLVLPSGKILVGVYFGLRWFKLSDAVGTAVIENSFSRSCE